MTTITAPYSPPSTVIRRALLADAAISGATGALMALGAAPLGGLLGLPVALLFWAGLSLLPFAAVLLYLARREPVAQRAIRGVIAYNWLWAIDSVLLLLSGWVDPTALGYVFVAGQAVAVAAFACIQSAAMRRARTA